MKKQLLLLVLCLGLCERGAANVIVVGSLARQKTLKTGEAFDGVIYLKNSEKEPTEARVYQSDYRHYADGRDDFSDPGTNPRSNASWITISPTRVKIRPGETIAVHYKGKAPADQNLRGTFWSMIMIEPTAVPAPIILGKDQQIAMGISTLVRFGVQIATDIGNGGERNLRVLNKTLTQRNGKRVLQLDVENSGENLLVPAISVELFDHTGASIGRFEGGRPRIYPTCSIRSIVDLNDVPAGKYAAMVLLDNGDEHVMGAQYELDLSP